MKQIVKVAIKNGIIEFYVMTGSLAEGAATINTLVDLIRAEGVEIPEISDAEQHPHVHTETNSIHDWIHQVEGN